MTTESVWRVPANTLRTRTFTVLDDDQVPVDITAWQVDAAIKSRPGGNVLHTFPSGDWVIVSGPAGQVRLTIPAAVSAAWSFGHAWYRVRVYDNPTHAERVLEGPLIVSPD